MNLTDITWGGEAKCEFEINRIPPAIAPGTNVNLEYDYIAQDYAMLIDQERFLITQVTPLNRAVLDEYIRDGSWRANLVRVIDVEERNVTIRIHIFFSTIELNQLQPLKIQVTNNLIERLPSYARGNPTEFLKNEFVFNNNTVFAIGFEKQIKMQIISKRFRLDVQRRDNIYIANRIRKETRDITNPVHMIRGVIEFTDVSNSAIVSQEVEKQMRRINNPDSYFEIWNAYMELEKYSLFKQAVDDGIAEYESYDVEVKDAFIYRFNLKENALENAYEDNAQIDCTDDDTIMRIEKWEDLSEIKDFKPIQVGQVLEVNDKRIIIVDKSGDTVKKLPKSGYLFKSVSGDKTRLQRRMEAKSTITNGLAPIRNLAVLIDSGVSISSGGGTEQAITGKLMKTMERSLGKKVGFNDTQQKAIEIALNTPDIALIQGPPGTGKTTVIKAIIARFEEYFRNNNHGEIPRILVTSFQHEAVDNAVSGLKSSGLPPNRTGGKRGEGQKQDAVIAEWIIKENRRCEELLEKLGTPTIYKAVKAIQDQYFAWYSTGKEILAGISILESIVRNHGLYLSTDLRMKVDEVIGRTQQKASNAHSQDQLNRIDLDDIKDVVGKQRIDRVSFADDGVTNAMELRFTIEDGTLKNEQIPECLLQVITTGGQDEHAFREYSEYVKSLQEKYLIEPTASLAEPVTSKEIETYIDAAVEEVREYLSHLLSNKDEAKAQILQQYCSNISEETVARQVINRYSNIRAATCQQAMDVGRNARNVQYDMVIVDEAARANPLDLFIPMSMGRRVILVGDHKQLPHMLEPEVVKKLNQDQKLKELDILRKSLFERLFDIFEAQRLEGGIQRTCKLNVQYRMQPSINEFVSKEFYDNDLNCADMQWEWPPVIFTKPLVWIDASQQNYGIESMRRSKSRPKEAELLLTHVVKAVRAHPGSTIGIITFYARQKEELEKIAENKLTTEELSRVEIGTVDAFQGREFDMVFLSCVRANPYGNENLNKKVGFLNDRNRLCVSFSRARYLLVIVGDSDTVKVVEGLGALLERCKSGVGEYI